MSPAELNIKIYADGANREDILRLAQNPLVTGFTTNPTLMRQAGVTDYEAFARALLAELPDKPISFEVFADDLPTMAKQARAIAAWGGNVNVKIPVTNTNGESTADIVAELSAAGVVVNVTALFTVEQVNTVVAALAIDTPAILSVFAGRLADSGHDPEPMLRECNAAMASKPKADLLWASTREPFNVIQAARSGCDIITAPAGIIDKLALFGKDPVAYSLDTVKAFDKDATAAGFSIAV